LGKVVRLLGKVVRFLRIPDTFFWPYHHLLPCQAVIETLFTAFLPCIVCFSACFFLLDIKRSKVLQKAIRYLRLFAFFSAVLICSTKGVP
jgi:hypothetical protein